MSFSEVRSQIESLVSLSYGRAVPFLWVSPDMLKDSHDLSAYFFLTEQKFAGIKIHGYHQNWNPEGKELRCVLKIARDKNLPVMFHTGGREICDSKMYRNICLEFPDVKIILAHGRPIDECISVMNECPNAWTDTAFMSVNNIMKLRDSELISRVLWGSDFPVMRYFYDMPPEKYYANKVNEVRKSLGIEDFNLITCENFTKLFD